MLYRNNILFKCYVQKKIGQYKQKKADLVARDLSIKGVKIHRWIHPFLMYLLRIKSALLGLKYEFINETKIDAHSGEAVIYAITHIGKYDYEMIVEACDIFAYAFAGDWELMYATIDDYFLRANGVLWVDTSDKVDRQNSYNFMIKALKQGIPILIYPEGIWNLTKNLPVMKLYSGATKAARECNVRIVPIAIEQRKKHFYINIGKKLDFSCIEENKATQVLRDTLATLMWEIWDSLPQEERKNISDEYYKKFVKERLAECTGFTEKVVKDRMFKDKTDREIQEIERDIEGLRNMC